MRFELTDKRVRARPDEVDGSLNGVNENMDMSVPPDVEREANMIVFKLGRGWSEFEEAIDMLRSSNYAAEIVALPRVKEAVISAMGNSAAQSLGRVAKLKTAFSISDQDFIAVVKREMLNTIQRLHNFIQRNTSVFYTEQLVRSSM